MKIILTGGLGHIGSSLLHKLPNLMDVSEIVIIDSLATQRYHSLFELPNKTKYTFIQDDIRKLGFANIAKCENASILVHLAAINDISSGTLNYADIENNNLGATNAAISLCQRFDLPMIFPSSTSVYTSSGLNVIETQPLGVNSNIYSRCKAAEEDCVKNFFSGGGTGVIFRLGTIHGVSNGMRFHTAINKFCFQIAIGDPISIWRSALNQRRPYLSLIDLVNAINFVVTKDLFDNETYNIVTKNYSILEILEIFSRIIGEDVKYIIEDNKRMNSLDLQVSNEKFASHGFVFQGNIESDIADTLKKLGDLR